MKIKFYTFLATALLAFGLNTSHAQDIVANGDFESWTANVPDSWTLIDPGITLSEETGIIHGGASSCKVQVTTMTQADTDFRQSVDVVAGTTYDVSLWVYQADTTARVRLYVGTYQDYSDPLLTDQWQQMTFTYSALVTESIEIGARFYDTPGFVTESIIYLDDFTMTPQVVTEPTITIISPLEGAIESSSDVTVEFVTQNFVVATAGLGDGHIHYYVDGAMTMYYSPDPILLTGLSEGAHEVILKLVDDSHADLVPSVADTVNFTVTLPTEVATIADLRAQAQGGIYTLTGEAFVTYARTPRNQKYIQDATAGILIDDNPGVITTTYVIGDGMTGVTGTLSSFNEVLQFRPAADPGAPSSTGNVTVPQTITLADLNANQSEYESELILLEGISFDDAGTDFAYNQSYGVTQGAEPGTFRTQFAESDYIGTTIPAYANVTALGSGFFGSAQFVARDLNDIEEAVQVPVNDECDGAPITDVTVGVTATVFGDGTGATAGATFPVAEVWEAFTLTECANVVIDFCGSDPLATALYVNLFTECPIGTSLPAGTVTLIECAGSDSALSVSFQGLEAGTYYYPVIADVAGYNGFGEYTMNINAVACPPPGPLETCELSEEVLAPSTTSNTGLTGTGGSQGIAAAWYYYTATADGFINVTSCLGGADTRLWIWEGACDNLVAVADTDDDCAFAPDGTGFEYAASLSDIPVSAGTTYYIEWDATWSSDPFDWSIDFTIIDAVDEIALSDFTIYPNPNNGQFNIVNEGVNGNYIIELIDVTGKVVYSEQMQLNSNDIATINSGDVNTGIYLVKMTNTDENYYRTLRMVIK